MTVPPEIEEFAQAAANNFHSKVVAAFRAADWNTLVSPYYLDASTSRAREIDLVAQKTWQFPRFISGREDLHFKLFVECKYIPNSTVFWFDDRDDRSAREWLVRNTPLPNPTNTYTANHHYLSTGDKVAKLFAAQGSRDTEREAIYKALNQVLHSMVYLRRKGNLVPAASHSRFPSRSIELPVIVVNRFDQVFRVDMSDLNTITQVDSNFQLEVNYAYLDPAGQGKREYFLVDVVSLELLNDFFAALDRDAQDMAIFIGRD